MPYFEPEKDKEDRTTYYRGIDFNANGAKIFKALSALLTETHETQLSYKAASAAPPRRWSISRSPTSTMPR